MTEGQTLYLILSFLYLSECLIWIGKRTVLFFPRWPGRWGTLFAGEYFGNANGSVVFLNPLPALGSNFLGHWMPISISPSGICAFTLQAFQGKSRPFQSGMVLVYEEISESTTEGKYLLINGSRFVKCCSVEQAESIAELINFVSSKPMKKREKIIREFWDLQFAKEKALKHLAQVSDLADGMRWGDSVFFIFLYVITPIMVSAYGLSRLVIPVAVVMLLSALIISVQYFINHKTIFPAESHERLSNVVKMILCPPVAIRSADFLTLKAMSRFHPLLLANILLGSHNVKFTRAIISDLMHPIRHDLTDSRALSIVSWHSSCELAACRKFFNEQCSKTLEEFLAPPVWDGISSSYCPRCSCQFTTCSGECPDCPGVELLPFPFAHLSEATHEQ